MPSDSHNGIEWTPAPPGRYPEPAGPPGAPFADPNLKLRVMGALHQLGLLDLGTPYELAAHVRGKRVDLEEEGYALMPDVYDYLARYPLSEGQLAAVETVSFDHFDVCTYAWYFWGGETGEFEIASLAGLEHCVNLKTFFGLTTPGATDLQVLGPLQRLERVVLEPGQYVHADVLLGLRELREVKLFEGSLDAALIDALRVKGASVVVYD